MMLSDLITRAAIKGDEGDSLMGVDCTISRRFLQEMELLVSHMRIKSSTQTVSDHNSLHLTDLSCKKKKKIGISILARVWDVQQDVPHPPTHPPTDLVSSGLRPQALVKVYKELWGASG